MTEDIKLECLRLASYNLGEDAPFKEVLIAAEEFYSFVSRKPKLRLVTDEVER